MNQKAYLVNTYPLDGVRGVLLIVLKSGAASTLSFVVGKMIFPPPTRRNPKVGLVDFSPYNARPVFDRYNELIKEDKVDATPSCVIYRSGMKEKFTGAADVVKALKRLQKAKQDGSQGG